MSKYYVLKIDSLTHVFTLVESGKDCNFSFKLITNDNVKNAISGLVQNDFIVCSIDNNAKILFKVSSVESDNILLTKIAEVEKGYIFEDINFITNLNEQLLIEIDKDLFNKIKDSFFIEKEMIMEEKLPFVEFQYKVFDDVKVKKFNRIIFGAPGTGKSYKIKSEIRKIDNNGILFKEDIDETKRAFSDSCVERITFHPNYNYAQFVGTYKPITKENGEIAYKYVEGPFMRLLTAALENAKVTNNDKKRYLLIIEEINRANVAAVFGDMFQLLDRDTDGVSDYEIQTSEDVRKYLASKLGGDGTEDKYKTLKLPNNFYIWATMNSADQGVQPMDAAFKRRWNFEYLNIDEGAFKINIPIPNSYESDGTTQKWVDIDWDELRTSINETLKKIPGVNEDKLLGPFFIGNEVKIKQLVSNKEEFNELFKSKILMYLFEDVVKMNPSDLFNKKEGENVHYSDVCQEYDKKGLKVFVKTISDSFELFKSGDSE